jgi:hypothetical protein
LAGFVMPQKLHDLSHEEDFFEGKWKCAYMSRLFVILLFFKEEIVMFYTKLSRFILPELLSSSESLRRLKTLNLIFYMTSS